MIRFLILFIVGFVFYRAIRSWMFKGSTGARTVSSKTTGEIDDIMIKDPYCSVYFPKRTGVPLDIDGKELYFCSTDCREKYLDANQKSNP